MTVALYNVPVSVTNSDPIIRPMIDSTDQTAYGKTVDFGAIPLVNRLNNGPRSIFLSENAMGWPPGQSYMWTDDGDTPIPTGVWTKYYDTLITEGYKNNGPALLLQYTGGIDAYFDRFCKPYIKMVMASQVDPAGVGGAYGQMSYVPPATSVAKLKSWSGWVLLNTEAFYPYTSAFFYGQKELAPLAPSIASGGTGYDVGDLCDVVGGTGTAMRVQVTQVSGGVVTRIGVYTRGSYTVNPANGAATTIVSSGAGRSGLTLNFTRLGVASGGTGYSVNDILTLQGGNPITAATVKVTSVSGGVVTGITQAGAVNGVYADGADCPNSPASTTGGTGSGCTITAPFLDVIDPVSGSPGRVYGSYLYVYRQKLKTALGRSPTDAELRESYQAVVLDGLVAKTIDYIKELCPKALVMPYNWPVSVPYSPGVSPSSRHNQAFTSEINAGYLDKVFAKFDALGCSRYLSYSIVDNTDVPGAGEVTINTWASNYTTTDSLAKTLRSRVQRPIGMWWQPCNPSTFGSLTEKSARGVCTMMVQLGADFAVAWCGDPYVAPLASGGGTAEQRRATISATMALLAPYYNGIARTGPQ